MEYVAVGTIDHIDYPNVIMAVAYQNDTMVNDFFLYCHTVKKLVESLTF